VVNSIKYDNGVAWIYQNNAFIEVIVGEKANLLLSELLL
jgi:hypothetical protein